MENHYLSVENREKLTINQVIDVEAFDEQNLWANIKDGAIEISGDNLNVEKLDLEEGLLIIRGNIKSFCYLNKNVKPKNQLIGIIKRK